MCFAMYWLGCEESVNERELVETYSFPYAYVFEERMTIVFCVKILIALSDWLDGGKRIKKTQNSDPLQNRAKYEIALHRFTASGAKSEERVYKWDAIYSVRGTKWSIEDDPL